MYWPDRVERTTGVPEADLVRAVRLLAAAPHAMILTARGAEQHSSGTGIDDKRFPLSLARMSERGGGTTHTRPIEVGFDQAGNSWLDPATGLVP